MSHDEFGFDDHGQVDHYDAQVSHDTHAGHDTHRHDAGHHNTHHTQSHAGHHDTSHTSTGLFDWLWQLFGYTNPTLPEKHTDYPDILPQHPACTATPQTTPTLDAKPAQPRKRQRPSASLCLCWSRSDDTLAPSSAIALADAPLAPAPTPEPATSYPNPAKTPRKIKRLTATGSQLTAEMEAYLAQFEQQAVPFSERLGALPQAMQAKLPPEYTDSFFKHEILDIPVRVKDYIFDYQGLLQCQAYQENKPNPQLGTQSLQLHKIEPAEKVAEKIEAWLQRYEKEHKQTQALTYPSLPKP